MIAQARSRILTDLKIETPFLDILPPEIGDLHNLSSQSLGASDIVGLSPIIGLKNLTTLQCTSAQVKDSTLLVGLTKLSSLDISGSPIRNLTPLARLTGLSNLRLNDTEVTDLTPLVDLKKVGDGGWEMPRPSPVAEVARACPGYYNR